MAMTYPCTVQPNGCIDSRNPAESRPGIRINPPLAKTSLTIFHQKNSDLLAGRAWPSNAYARISSVSAPNGNQLRIYTRQLHSLRYGASHVKNIAFFSPRRPLQRIYCRARPTSLVLKGSQKAGSTGCLVNLPAEWLLEASAGLAIRKDSGMTSCCPFHQYTLYVLPVISCPAYRIVSYVLYEHTSAMNHAGRFVLLYLDGVTSAPFIQPAHH